MHRRKHLNYFKRTSSFKFVNNMTIYVIKDWRVWGLFKINTFIDIFKYIFKINSSLKSNCEPIIVLKVLSKII